MLRYLRPYAIDSLAIGRRDEAQRTARSDMTKPCASARLDDDPQGNHLAQRRDCRYRSFIGFTADGRGGVSCSAIPPLTPTISGFATLNPQFPLSPTIRRPSCPVASFDDYVGSYKVTDKFPAEVPRTTGCRPAIRTRLDPHFPVCAHEFFAKRAGPQPAASFTRDPTVWLTDSCCTRTYGRTERHPAPS